MKTVNVGLIGFGFIGKVHAYGYRTLAFYVDPPPLNGRVTHVCTSRQATADRAAALVGAAHAVTDYRAVTEDPAVDVVHICTPNHLHRDALLSAMAHNKHIYCDKPLTATLAEARQVEAALPTYTGVAQMTFQVRFFPAVRRARQLIREGGLGELLQFRCAYLHAGSADPGAPLKWKLSAAAGGGVIADLGSHALDLVHALAGDYATVAAATKIAFPDRPAVDDPSRRVPVEAEDCVFINARMANGALGVIEATKLATGTEDEFRFELHGTAGALRFNSMEPHHLELYDVGVSSSPLGGRRGWTRIDVGQRFAPPEGFPGPKFTAGWLRVHVGCLYNFLQCVAADRPAEPGLRQGIYVQHLMQCVREAAAAGSWVAV